MQLTLEKNQNIPLLDVLVGEEAKKSILIRKVADLSNAYFISPHKWKAVGV